jgi:hypothetical protein
MIKYTYVEPQVRPHCITNKNWIRLKFTESKKWLNFTILPDFSSQVRDDGNGLHLPASNIVDIYLQL